MIRLIFILFYSSLSAATISGKITDYQTGKGIPGVNVWIRGTNMGVATDSTGSYTIKDIPEGQYRLQTNYILYCPQSQTINISLKNDKITVDFSLHMPSIAITESEKIKKYQENIDAYRKPISCEIKDYKISENRVELEISITNNTPYELFLLRSLPCFELFKVIIYNQTGERAEPPMIDLYCDDPPLQLPHKSDLFRIKPNETVRYPNPIVSDKIVNTFEKGRYLVWAEYEYELPKTLGPTYVECNKTANDYTEEIDVLTKILRGHFVSVNNVNFEID